MYHHYRPRSLDKVMFLQVSVCPQGVLMMSLPVMDSPPPPTAPSGQHHPPNSTTPPSDSTTPTWTAPPPSRSTSGRYASYWNAFFLSMHILDIKLNFFNFYLLEKVIADSAYDTNFSENDKDLYNI